MPKVLILSYFFPPLGGAGVQRSVKFVRYLPECGYDPIVVTCSRAEGPPIDATLGAEIHANVPVYRVPAAEASTSVGLLRHLRTFARILSPKMRAWRDGATALGDRAIREHRPQVLFASASPFCTFLAAAELSRRRGIPWVADLRDPWALDEMVYYPTRWHRALERRAMRAQLSTAARVVMNTPEAGRALGEAFPELAERIRVVTNGYDPADFDVPPAPRCHGKFRIVHTGHLHATLGKRRARHSRLRQLIGGHLVPVDALTRSHVHLLGALTRWRKQSPDLVARVEVVLAGPLKARDQQVIAESGVADLVDARGYVDHSASVALLRSADLLFLPMHNVPVGYRSRIVPGKTYEYLAASRPILAAVPKGDARDFIMESKLGECCEPDDEVAMLEILKRQFESWSSTPGALRPNDDFLRRFDRRTLTRQLASVLRDVIAEGESLR